MVELVEGRRLEGGSQNNRKTDWEEQTNQQKQKQKGRNKRTDGKTEWNV
jgi:hypothetical protein